MPVDPYQRRAARRAQPPTPAPLDPAAVDQAVDQTPKKPRKAPLTVDRITDAALEVVATEGYDALTMRRVAAVLGTGPASLYVHVVNKADIDELIIGRICSALDLPEPDPANWRDQILDVCAQARDQFLKYPGVSRAALAMVSTNLDILRVNEGFFALLLAGGIEPQKAAWGIDALWLYVCAYALETSLVAQLEVLNREDIVDRFRALPAEQFPQTRRYATELTSGIGHERFDFALRLMIDNLGH